MQKQSSERIPDEHMAILQPHHDYMLDKIDPEPIVHSMFSKEIFSLDDKEQVLKADNRRNKMVIFLKLLYRSGSNAYPVFYEALENSGYVEMIKLFDDQDKQNRTSEPTFDLK
ncbi:hypothetical protein SNE40_021749 [Patella caerulea]|uniref:CARD domain-containing protein n=1 Tax=Patella caerulea TaxID=87958 RepID=A0AAN8IZD0_PATCE